MKRIVIGVILFLSVAAFAAWIGKDALFSTEKQDFYLYGNVDDRELNLSFLTPERIAKVYVDEGALVKMGDLLAELEDVRIKNTVSAAYATRDGAKAKLEKLLNGTRKEDIEIARSGVTAAKAKLKQTESDFNRQRTLEDSAAVSVQLTEQAEALYYLSLAACAAAENNLQKQIDGPRKEDIELAKAELARAETEVLIQEQNLVDSKLHAPCDGIIRSRLQHPGERAAPGTPVLTLAIVSPKWIRAYIPETMLTRIKAGDKAKIRFDSMGKNELDGWVGFISPSAEFTPKNVETTELRTSLVYEIRVFVEDPENLLKLGSPATVVFPDIGEK